MAREINHFTVIMNNLPSIMIVISKIIDIYNTIYMLEC